jgi:hypothetical protein
MRRERSRRFRRGALLGALLALAAGGARAVERTFVQPKVGQHRLDLCLEWGALCNGESAEVFCRGRGFDRALAWKPDPDIGDRHPTIVLGTGQTCAESFCDGYASITCVRESEWTRRTGQGGLLVHISDENLPGPVTGLLVIAVAESDARRATTCVIDASSTCLLELPPGKYWLFQGNWKNDFPLRAAPEIGVEVPAGRHGLFIEWWARTAYD